MPSNLTLDEIESDLGGWLKALRLDRNINQSTLAERAGISVSALKALENGTGSTLRIFVAVLRVLKREDWLKSIAPVASINPLTMTRTANPRRRASKQLRPGAAPHKRAEGAA